MSLNIPFRGIVSIVTRNHYIFMNHELKHLELTEGQVPCLMVLSKKGGITQDDLSRMFHIDKGTIARAIKKIRGKGHGKQSSGPGQPAKIPPLPNSQRGTGGPGNSPGREKMGRPHLPRFF